jgi:hypothetical protein
MANQFVAQKKMDNQSVVNREMSYPPLLLALTRKTADTTEGRRIDGRSSVRTTERYSQRDDGEGSEPVCSLILISVYFVLYSTF